MAGTGQLAAQELAGVRAGEVLPEAPQPNVRLLTGEDSPQAASNAAGRIKGVIADMQGGLVPGAHVTAICKETPGDHQTIADAQGFFSMADLPAGTYSITISAPGLQTYVLQDIHLKVGENYALPEILLPLARTSADVEVIATQEQLAEAELDAELKQRVLGILPNFYTSYQWDAAPLNARQKFKLTMRAGSDPVFFATTGIIAGIEHINNTFPDYGDGAPGYWRRYGAAYGDAVIGRTLGAVVFASLFHQDPRYFVMTNGPIPKRAWHAVSSTFIQRGDNLRWQPGYAHLLGNAVTGVIASTYHPDKGMGELVLDNTVLGLGGQAVNNLIREFILRHLAKNIPSYANGKPPED
ncbi:MAG TPA: carboxypeptidase-like regulatory domain-containing protein [Acidobacteriaceae bacterium]|nr:carboxypeptidase-like regulatory domain-containing protein [Acidobacteriaceae bacterium]